MEYNDKMLCAIDLELIMIIDILVGLHRIILQVF